MRTREEKKEHFSKPEFPGSGRVHFIGIGGAGMSGIARVLLHAGREVTGSDEVESATTRDLAARGARTFIGHEMSNVEGAETVVVSDAVDLKTNPEFLAAKSANLALLTRSQALAAVLKGKKVLAVTGSHGKSSTTAILGQILAESGLDPLVIVGADVPVFDKNVRFGNGEYAVVEACEAYSGIDDMDAETVLLTNLEPEHMDYHGTWESLRADVVRFSERAKGETQLVYCEADEGAAEVAKHAEAREAPYDLSHELRNGAMAIPGTHNRLNASGAVKVAETIGIDRARAIEIVRKASGCARRLERIGESHGVIVYDDYAHHPTEIEKSIDALREANPGTRLVIVYQPHLYSRTLDELDNFAPAFKGADHVVFTDIYPAREQQIPGVSSALIAERMEVRGQSCDYVASRHLLPRFVEGIAKKGDVVVGMGAGNIEFFARDFLAELDRRDRLRVCVMLGGESAEREVSLTSGRMIANALRSRGYEVTTVDPTELLFNKGSVSELTGPERPDIVFTALHGTGAEDGRIQGFLELLHIPYVGSGVEASALAMNKRASKRAFADAGLPVADGVTVRLGEPIPELRIPCVVKPNAQGSTIGLSFVRSRAELPKAVSKALKYDDVALIEELVEGVEISVPVLGDEALPVVEICPKSGSYDFMSKYTEGATDEIIPARIPPAATQLAQQYALAAHKLVGAADFSRTDMIVSGDRIVILEINTVPGMTNTSLVPNSAAAAGISYEDLCERILNSALERYGIQKAR
jgi:D-alanine--D-alanine ligase